MRYLLIILSLVLFSCSGGKIPVSSINQVKPESNFVYSPNGKTEFVINDYTSNYYHFCESLENCANTLSSNFLSNSNTNDSFRNSISAYVGKKGYFLSEEPIYSYEAYEKNLAKNDNLILDLDPNYDYYPIIFEDGRKCIYFVSKNKNLFYPLEILSLEHWKEEQEFKPEPLLEGSDILVLSYKIIAKNDKGEPTIKKYYLSDGTTILNFNAKYPSYADCPLELLRKFIPSNIQNKTDINRALEIFRSKNIVIKYDEFEKLYFITPNYGRTNSHIKFYISVREYGEPYLRFKLNYSSEDWLFVDYFKVTTSDSNWTSDTYTFERDNRSGTIWEWIDINATDEIVTELRKVAEDDDSMLRFYGSKYYKDMNISNEMRKNIIDVLDLYSIMKNK